MLPHWDTVIHPCLQAFASGPLIEVGAAHGATTEKLAEFAVEHDLVLHTVEPSPLFDVQEYERRYGRHFRFHRARSHDVLDRVGPFSVALIGGDPNWYTVHGDLTRLVVRNSGYDFPFPLTFVHEVEPPHARRDMYYDPEAIPAKWRQPWAHRGIRWGEVELADEGWGLHEHHANAIREGGAKNGVLTAVEDFLRESQLRISMRVIRGDSGLGVLACDDLLMTSPALKRKWEELNSHEFLLAEAKRLSNEVSKHIIRRLEIEYGVREAKGWRA